MSSIAPARSRVLLLGTHTYSHPRLTDIPAVSNNVRDLAVLLAAPGPGELPSENCVTVPPDADVRQAGRLLLSAAQQAEDMLLVYYAGHGLLSPRSGELYLTLADTDPENLWFTAMSMSGIKEVFLDSPARCRVLILDCCYSGRSIGQPLSDTETQVLEQVRLNGTFTLTSAPANRVALTLPGEAHTAFTGRLITLLREGVEDDEAKLCLDGIYRQLYSRALIEGLPLPQQRSTGNIGQLRLLGNRRYRPLAGPLDEERVLLLILGRNTYGDEIYSYILIRTSEVERLKERLAFGEGITPSHYGVVVAAGRGKPTPAITEEVGIPKIVLYFKPDK